MFCTRAAKSASRGTVGDNHICCRQGFNWWFSKIRRTVSGEMLATTPSRTNCSANSRQSHCDKERPSLSGRSQAILTTWRATSGGKDGLAPGSWSIRQASYPLVEEAPHPLAGVTDSHADEARCVGQAALLVQHQEQTGSPHGSCLEGGRSLPMFQLGALFGSQLNDKAGLAAPHGVLE